MIASIYGKIEDTGDKYVVIETNGLSYKIFVPRSVLEKIKIGDTTKFFTRLYLRETTQDIYGFLDKKELNLFEQLISVSGVGPSHALNILSIAPSDAIAAAIIKSDTKFLTQIPGVGRKTGEKIIIELKEKLLKTGLSPRAHILSDGDAVDALVALGYSQTQARSALSEVSEKTTTLEDRIKDALKNLSKKSY